MLRRADGDRIDLSAIDANNLMTGNQAFSFRGTAAFTAPGQVRYSQSGGNTILEVNIGHDNVSKMQIKIAVNINLTNSDFFL